jgi:SAM-dependent methyltransferase
MEGNQKAYNSSLAIKTYYSRVGLTMGEIPILKYLIEKKKNVKMLDIGIGCGRTFEAFSQNVNEYIGIDYSNLMIEACKEKFKNSEDVFFMSDARNMANFSDSTFDFILFSFNGIDCVNKEERIQIFKEIKRVAKNTALFAFSSHNLYNIPKLFKFKIPKNPFNYLLEYRRNHFTKNSNQPLESLLEKDIVIIRDGDINHETSYCYVNPEFQLKQLCDLGFEIKGIYSDFKNYAYPLNSNWPSVSEPWLYYLCQIIK